MTAPATTTTSPSRARPGPARGALPVDPTHGRLAPLGLGAVELHDGALAHLQQLGSSAVLQHCAGWLERAGWVRNFDLAAQGRLPEGRQGREFSDSEVYKLLEALAWESGRTGDPALERQVEDLTARVAAAQEEDGYLSTAFGRAGQGHRWSDVEWGHELYCVGHLVQAAVARLRTGHDDELVAVARRAADLVCRVFGPDGDQRVCGHPEVEVALVELARATGEHRYLDQARLFVERRGHGVLAEGQFGPTYFQDDVPVREATRHRGHAVRALYLAAGALDLAVEDDDAELAEAVRHQTLATLARRTYLTGGMGAHHEGESFGDDFELPPDRAYSESCAGIGSVMVNQRLLLATGDPVHADAVERALHNVVAGAVGEEGRSFFYTNPLQVREPASEPPPDEMAPRAASSLRAPWFAVSCCPSNVARTFASLAALVASTDADGVQLHQYATCTVRAPLPVGEVVLAVTTDYPADGRVRVEVLASPEEPWSLSLRVPSWSAGSWVDAGGGRREVGPGTAVERRAFAAGDVVELELPLRARWTHADPRVDALRGQVAVERGPVVHCLESVDLGEDVGLAVVDAGRPPVEQDGQVLVPVAVRHPDEAAGAYADEPPAVPDPPAYRLVPLLPYSRRSNRGPSTLRVWMPTS
ncbi:beta-L-arabinofuranosidase domain-containing protein [Pseudokineococcus basanitobsidens]|uniref:Beta-L-arabinofuranosidase domain-containing protein n=1 Tax=Pseudokineococcus basanitobsidens TaxID=1926649 RepID=A0ABU8RFG9_9ACTN